METKNRQGRPKGGVKGGGRKKGTPNKDNKDLKIWVKQLLEENTDQLKEDFAELAPEKRWQIAEKLLNYVLPKEQSINTRINISELSDDSIDRLCQNL